MPITLTIRAPSLSLNGSKTSSGLKNNDHDNKEPPITAKGAKTHIPLVINWSSSDSQDSLNPFEAVKLVNRVNRTL